MGVFRRRGNPLSVVVTAVVGLGLTGCMVAGLEPFDDQGVVRGVTRTVGLSPKPAEAPDFVQGARPKDLEYVPVGVTPPARAIPLKNPKQLEAELAAKRSENEARAAAPKPGSPLDGKVEPGYKPIKLPPVPDSGPAPVMPGAAKVAPKAAGTAPQSAVPLRGETPEQRRLRRQRAAEKSGETN